MIRNLGSCIQNGVHTAIDNTAGTGARVRNRAFKSFYLNGFCGYRGWYQSRDDSVKLGRGHTKYQWNPCQFSSVIVLLQLIVYRCLKNSNNFPDPFTLSQANCQLQWCFSYNLLGGTELELPRVVVKYKTNHNHIQVKDNIKHLV